MTDKRLMDWWTVNIAADVTDATREHASAAGAVKVGLAGKDAWISAWSGHRSDAVETRVGTEDITVQFGFVDLDVEWSDIPDQGVVLWMPTTDAQALTVIDDLSETLLEVGEYANVAEAVEKSVSQEAVSCIVATPEGSRKATGVASFLRTMSLHEDRASIDYHILGFHSAGTDVDRGALLAAVYKQMLSDMETAFTSLSAADIDTPLSLDVHDVNEDSEILHVFEELAELATHHAFDLYATEIPDWVSMERYIANTGEQPAASTFPIHSPR
jgi:hypothetical protein